MLFLTQFIRFYNTIKLIFNFQSIPVTFTISSSFVLYYFAKLKSTRSNKKKVEIFSILSWISWDRKLNYLHLLFQVCVELVWWLVYPCSVPSWKGIHQQTGSGQIRRKSSHISHLKLYIQYFFFSNSQSCRVISMCCSL